MGTHLLVSGSTGVREKREGSRFRARILSWVSQAVPNFLSLYEPFSLDKKKVCDTHPTRKTIILITDSDGMSLSVVKGTRQGH
jgi:hypothetical protein